MPRKNKRPVVENAKVVTTDGTSLNPRLAGDIYRWRKSQEKREKEAAAAVSPLASALSGVRIRKGAVQFRCVKCDRKFDKLDSLETHRRMKHDEE